MAQVTRPTDTYTPTTTSVNINKYNEDSTAVPPIPIDSIKVDADINKLIDAVNEIDGLNAGGAYTDLPAAVNQIKTNEDAIDNIVAGMIPDGDYGDITVGGSGSTMTINDEAVTEVKLSPAVQVKLNSNPMDQDFIAKGPITAGDVAVLKPDGRVGAPEVDTSTLTLGNMDTFGSQTGNLAKTVYDVNTGQLILVGLHGSGVRVYAGAVDGTTNDFGAPVDQAATVTAINNLFAVVDGNNNLVVCVNDTGGGFDLMRFSIGTKTVTHLTTTNTVDSSVSAAATLIYEQSQDRVVFITRDVSGSNFLQGWSATSPNGSTAFGVGAKQTGLSNFAVSNNTNNMDAALSSVDNKIMVAVSRTSAATYASLLTVSGDIITLNSEQIIGNLTDTTTQSRIAYSPSQDKFLVATVEDAAPKDVYTAVVSVSGTSVVVDEALKQAFDGTILSVSYFGLVYDVVNDQFLTSVWNNAGTPSVYAYITEISSGVATSSALLNTGVSTDSSALDIDITSDATSFIVIQPDNANDYFSSYRINYDADAGNYVGVTQTSAVDTETVTVRMYGGVTTNQAGLTVNQNYFVDSGGSLTTTDNGRFIGKAIKADTLNMNRP